MKKKDIYEVSIKILGLIASWKFVETLIAYIFLFISFHSISTNAKFGFTGILQTNYFIWNILPVVLYGLFSFLFLFKSDKILSVLKLISPDEASFQIEKKTFYHIAVLLIGFFMFAYSGNQLSSNTFTNAKATTTTTTSNGIASNQRIEQATISSEQIKIPSNISATSSTTTSPISSGQINNPANIFTATSTTTSPTFSTTVNYISILIFLLSILIIIKSEKFSTMLMPKEKEELID